MEVYSGRKARRRRKKYAGLSLVLCVLGGLVVAVSIPPEAEDVRASGQFPTEAPAATAEDGREAQPLSSVSAFSSLTYLPLVANDFRHDLTVFGMQMRFVTEEEGLTQALGAGVTWVRAYPFAWDQIEPVRTTPPTYDWRVVNETSLANAGANGFEYIGSVHYAPEWAQQFPGVACGPIRQDALAGFAEYLQALVRRYSQAPYFVRYWELWNEPDVDHSLVNPHSVYGCWGDQSDEYYGGGYFAEMLKVAYPAIKAADPHAEVLVGGLLLDCDPRNPPPGNDCASSKFLEGILRNGGGPYFDLVAFHAYSYGAADTPGAMGNPNWPGSVTAIPEKVSFLQEVLQQYGFGNKRLMNTEAALLCIERTDACLETQAMHIPRAYAEALALGLKAEVYYELAEGGWKNTGLLLRDLTPKPPAYPYRAYQTAAAFLGSVRHIGPASGYPEGIEGYAFARVDSSGSVDLIWSADGSAISVPLPDGAQAYDVYGALIASAPGTIDVNYSPDYVARP